MLYVPSLNIVSPRARAHKFKNGKFNSQGKSSRTNNLDTNSKSYHIDNEDFSDAIDFAELATLPTV